MAASKPIAPVETKPAVMAESKPVVELPRSDVAAAPSSQSNPLRLSRAISPADSGNVAAAPKSPQRFDSETYAIAMRNVTPQSPAVQQRTPAVTPVAAVPVSRPAPVPNARTTTASLDGVIERLDRPGTTREPVPVARPLIESDPAYAALLIAESRRAQALQPAASGTGPSERVSSASDLSLASRQRMEDWR
jgi:hypothetical protein